ncbi:hypothetical protein BCR44DRAFT_131391 [Catenaria anguillulae PL171]|uniref:ATP-grasp domain-containing protein n=1 Tax=Catenaria anguillulae PL171 TaxID=765915 RepID=A0A1Y2HBG4_9FUNG|nr:hypothetical protein BCR44DRAFT_131391 [Catenaria anguillulae PL171]
MLIFNLCDGCDDLDGYPGGSIPRDLEAHGFAFTGSMSDFYRITTPKTLLKSYLQRHSVPTSDFVPIRADHLTNDVHTAIARLGFPLIVKPSISYASLGITSTSVTHSLDATLAQVASIFTEFPRAGVFIERYLAGREFTAVVTGNVAQDNVHVYPVAERAFRKDLGEGERFLAFDRYWAGWTIDGDRPDEQEEAYYSYRLAPAEWQAELMRIAREAYIACQGSGYGRVDFRTASADRCEPYVLEVNANCGLTFDETSSLGEILRLSNVAPLTFLQEIIDGAVSRWSATRCAETTVSDPTPDFTLDTVARALSEMDVNDKPLGPRTTSMRADSVLGSRQSMATKEKKTAVDERGAGV